MDLCDEKEQTVDLGGFMNKKKRIEEIQLARLRELLIAAILERSGKVVVLPSASVTPIVLKNIFKKFLMVLTVFIFLFSLKSFDVWFQELVTHPFNFLKDQMKFNPFIGIDLFLLIIVCGLSLWERKAFKKDQAQIMRRVKEEVLKWQNFTDKELPNSVKELKRCLAGNDDEFNNDNSGETIIKSLLRLFPRTVSQKDISILRLQLVNILSEQQQDASKLPKGVPYRRRLIRIVRIVLLSICLFVTLGIMGAFSESKYEGVIVLTFLGIPIGMLWVLYFRILYSVHEKRKRAFDNLFEIARAEVATYKGVAKKDVPEEIKHLQRFIEVLESKYHIPGEKVEWKKIKR